MENGGKLGKARAGKIGRFLLGYSPNFSPKKQPTRGGTMNIERRIASLALHCLAPFLFQPTSVTRIFNGIVALNARSLVANRIFLRTNKSAWRSREPRLFRGRRGNRWHRFFFFLLLLFSPFLSTAVTAQHSYSTRLPRLREKEKERREGKKKKGKISSTKRLNRRRFV